ncbi:MAG: hypothetical protein AAB444_00110 [Patescibacteria group bacterium]
MDIIYAESFIEEVQTLLRERQNVIAEFDHGILVAGTSGTLKGMAVYDPKGEELHAKRDMLTRFRKAAKDNNVGLTMPFDLMRELGCLVIDAPTQEQIIALRTLTV